MKTAIKVIALLIAAGYPVVAFAEFLGASVPHALNAENALAAFSVALVALLMIADYSPRRLTKRTPHVAGYSALATPARKRESHRLAA